MQTSLTHIDPSQNMDRWYCVTVQPSLLDPVAVICSWGSRRGRYQRLRVLPAESVAEANALATRILGAKVRRGYRADT